MNKTLVKKTIIITVAVAVMIGLWIGFNYFDLQSKVEKDRINLYEMAINEVIARNIESTEEREYIALYHESLVDLSSTQYKLLAERLNNLYGLEIIDSTYAGLIEQGIEQKGVEIRGLIIYIEGVRTNLFTVSVDVGLEYASMGAEGITIEFENRNGEWHIKDIVVRWVA